jgi:hypothetical protein
VRAVNQPGGIDTIGHSSVQAWSAGELFPCVIAVVERYEDPYQVVLGGEPVLVIEPGFRLNSVSYELIAYGRREEYATREDAEMVARWLNDDERLRAIWRREHPVREGWKEVQS